MRPRVPGPRPRRGLQLGAATSDTTPPDRRRGARPRSVRRRLVELPEGSASIVPTKGVADVEATEVDLTRPADRGPLRPDVGSLAGGPDEVVVNEALADKGYARRRRPRGRRAPTHRPDHRRHRRSRRTRATTRSRSGPLGSLGARRRRRPNLARRRRPGQLGDGAGAQHRRRDRALARGRPRPAADPPRWPSRSRPRPARRRCVAVDRAGRGDGPARGRPARRPGVRGRRPPTVPQPRPDGRHRRHARAGPPGRPGRRARPGRSRRRRSASSLGIGIGWTLLPIVQRFAGSWFGPFDVPWLHLVGIAGFGLLSAFLAAVVPGAGSRHARTSSRCWPGGAATGARRCDRRSLGLVLLGAGIAGCGVRRERQRTASSASPARRSWPCSA